MDRIIEVKVFGNHSTKDSNRAGTRGENITKLRITFDESWDNFEKTIIFWDAYGENATRVVPEHEDVQKSTRIYLATIPAEAMARTGELTFTIKGTSDTQKQTVTGKLKVEDTPDILDPIPPTPDELTQLKQQWAKASEDVQGAYDARDKAVAYAEVAAGAKNEARTQAVKAGEYADNANESAIKAENALGKTNYIGDNGNWYAWDSETDAFYDTGVKAMGDSETYVTREEFDANNEQIATDYVTQEGFDSAMNTVSEDISDLTERLNKMPLAEVPSVELACNTQGGYSLRADGQRINYSDYTLHFATGITEGNIYVISGTGSGNATTDGIYTSPLAVFTDSAMNVLSYVLGVDTITPTYVADFETVAPKGATMLFINHSDTHDAVKVVEKIPKVLIGTEHLTEEVNAELDKAHEHSNKDVLDGITEEDVENWNNKAEAEYVDEQVQKLKDQHEADMESWKHKADLDETGKVPISQLPDNIGGDVSMTPPDLSYEVVKGVKVGYFGSIKDDSECFTVYIKIPDKKVACIYATAKNATDDPNNDGSSYACSTLVCDENKTKIDKITSNTTGNYTCFNYSDVSSVDGACYVALSYTNDTEFEIKLHAIDAVNESYLPITATDLPDDFIINADNLIVGLSNVYYTAISNQNTWKYSANAVTELFEITNGKTYYHNGSYVYISLFDENYSYIGVVSNFASGSVLECDDTAKYAFVSISGANSAVAEDFWFSEVDLSGEDYKPNKKINPKYIGAISSGSDFDIDAITQSIETAQTTAENAQADIDALKAELEGDGSDETIVTKDSHFVASDIEYEIIEGKKVNYYGTQLLDDENCFTVYIKIPDKKFAYIKATITNSIHTISETDYSSGTLLCNANKEIISKAGATAATIYTVFPYSTVSGVEDATYFAISYNNGTEVEIKVNGIDAINESYLPISKTDAPDDLIINADNVVTEIEDLKWRTGANRWTYISTSPRTNFFEVSNGDIFYHNGNFIYLHYYDENYTYLGASSVISSGVTAVEMENVKYAYAYSTTDGNVSADLWISRTDLSRKKYKPSRIINPKYVDLNDIDRNQIKSWYNGKRASFLGDSLTATGSGSLYINYLNEFFGFASVTNCGKGGTLVSGETISMGDPFWYDSRVNAIDIDSDIIFIAGGTNDANNNITLGDNDISNCDTSTFYGAYHVLISKLIYKFYKLDAGYYDEIDYSGVTQVEEAKPVQIFLITPPYMMGSETAYNKTPAFAEAVIEIGKLLGIPVCDTRANSGVNMFTATYHRTANSDGSYDYIHLNDEAHKSWAKVMIGKMLECEPLE